MATRTGSGLGLDKKDDLMLNFSLAESSNNLVYHGYKREFITQQLSAMEEALAVCSKCSGILRDACNIREGEVMVCEACVGVEEGAQPVGAVRIMVSNLRCRCPLKHRGCRWEGTVGQMGQHLNECDHLMVLCPYSAYGCGKELQREEFEMHRREGKEYHNELMSIFMAERVERQAVEIKKLQVSINELIEERKYLRVNGVVWRIKDCESIKEKISIFTRSSEIISYRESICTDPISPISNQDDKVMKEGKIKQNKCYKGPKFVLGPWYVVSLQLLIDKTSGEVSLNLLSDKSNVKEKHLKWPLQGKCKVIILNQQNADTNWRLETDTFELSREGTVKLTSIPSGIISADEYNGTIILKVLFDIEQ
ncbi:TNF receptor-associated factor 4-like [Oopsacas minuta]|uniref:TNF receptor-associated factor 4-like n=1 Tax=Oopsacas minuta TaxID=111878 RepID=A0AAV7JS50_9METZ|nr:TNF receptor-associated factor 4-like [Oopsacas minuta]